MFDELFGLVDSMVINNVSHLVGTFITIITPLLAAGVTTYVLMMIMQWFYNPGAMPLLDVMKMLFSLSLVTGIALSAPWYLANVVPAVLYTGDEVTLLLLDNGLPAQGALQRIFDVMWARILAVLNTSDIGFSPASWWDSFLVLIQVAVMLICFVFFL